MENVPLAPATFVCGTKVWALSTSETVSVPPVLSTALVSDSATVADDTTAASFVPLMVTCTVLVVPSADATVNESDTDWPTVRLSNALLAAQIPAPFTAMANEPLVSAALDHRTKVRAPCHNR